jgi:uncharacterized protein YecT (DUF1311 family)
MIQRLPLFRYKQPVGVLCSLLLVIAAHISCAASSSEGKSSTGAIVYSIPELKKLAGTDARSAYLRGAFVVTQSGNGTVQLRPYARELFRPLAAMGSEALTEIEVRNVEKAFANGNIFPGSTKINIRTEQSARQFQVGKVAFFPKESPLELASVTKLPSGDIVAEAYLPGARRAAAPSKAVVSAGHADIDPKLLIGFWQGGRHVTEFRRNGEFALDPDPTGESGCIGEWRIAGDQLEEGTQRYKVVTLTSEKLVIRDERGNEFTSTRISSERTASTQASQQQSAIQITDSQSSTTARESAEAHYNQADVELNKVYRQLIAQLPPDRQKQLKKEQREWIADRDASALLAERTAYGSEDAYFQAMASKTSRRAEELKSLLSHPTDANSASTTERQSGWPEPGALHPRNRIEKASYAVGAEIGRNLRDRNLNVDADELANGLCDALAGKPQLTEEQIRENLAQLGTEPCRGSEQKPQQKLTCEGWVQKLHSNFNSSQFIGSPGSAGPMKIPLGTPDQFTSVMGQPTTVLRQGGTIMLAFTCSDGVVALAVDALLWDARKLVMASDVSTIPAN